MNGDQRETLERQAENLRSRLAHTLSELDRRRHEVVELGHRVAEKAKQPAALLAFGGGLALLGGGLGGLIVYRAQLRARSLMARRVRALRRWWRKPELLAPLQERSMAVRIARNLLISVVSFAAAELAKKRIRALLPPASEPARAGH